MHPRRSCVAILCTLALTTAVVFTAPAPAHASPLTDTYSSLSSVLESLKSVLLNYLPLANTTSSLVTITTSGTKYSPDLLSLKTEIENEMRDYVSAQADALSHSISQGAPNLSNISNSTITNSSFSGSTVTLTGLLTASSILTTSAATSTIAGGVNLSTGCYAVNGVCLGSGGGTSNWATTSTDYWLAQKSTSNLAEGSNLYYTANRVAGVIAGTTTTALAEGNNLYFTPSGISADSTRGAPAA